MAFSISDPYIHSPVLEEIDAELEQSLGILQTVRFEKRHVKNLPVLKYITNVHQSLHNIKRLSIVLNYRKLIPTNISGIAAICGTLSDKLNIFTLLSNSMYRTNTWEEYAPILIGIISKTANDISQTSIEYRDKVGAELRSINGQFMKTVGEIRKSECVDFHKFILTIHNIIYKLVGYGIDTINTLYEFYELWDICDEFTSNLGLFKIFEFDRDLSFTTHVIPMLANIVDATR
jgi:hypothetical protein